MNTSAEKWSESHNCISSEIVKAVYFHVLNLENDGDKQTYAGLDRIKDRRNILPNIDEPLCRALAKLFNAWVDSYTHSMITAYVLSDVNEKGAT